MEGLVTWVKGIVGYSILVAVLTELLPSKFSKYIKLYMGLLFILLFLSPVMNLFHLEERMEDFFDKENLKIDLEDKSFELELKQKDVYEEIKEEYTKQLSGELSEFLQGYGYQLQSVDISWNEDTKAATFGEVKKATLSVVPIGEKDSDIHVDKVQVEVFHRQEENLEEKALKNELANFYNIEEDNINVSIQGGGKK